MKNLYFFPFFVVGKRLYYIKNQEFDPSQNIAQKSAKFLGSFLGKKLRLRPQKIAQMAKLRPIWSH
jgi:hypothetical protein